MDETSKSTPDNTDENHGIDPIANGKSFLFFSFVLNFQFGIVFSSAFDKLRDSSGSTTTSSHGVKRRKLKKWFDVVTEKLWKNWWHSFRKKSFLFIINESTRRRIYQRTTFTNGYTWTYRWISWKWCPSMWNQSTGELCSIIFNLKSSCLVSL